MPNSTGKRKTHKNDETLVRCPVEGCEKEVLSRGLHLHVMRSSSGDHGTQDEIPEDIDLDDAEEIGNREVTMEYPEERDSETVARLCPYCDRPFRGKHGVMIHLGQTAGRKNHPEDGSEQHKLDDFPIAEVDDDDNVVEVVDEGGATMPSTKRRQENESNSPNQEQVEKHIENLREQGLDEEADKAERMLLGE